jgi:hypothetical protein
MSTDGEKDLAELAAMTKADPVDANEQPMPLQQIQDAVQASNVKMDFGGAMQALDCCQAQLEQEKGFYSFFNDLINGKAELTTVSVSTGVTDGHGRPVIAKLPMNEILEAEVEDEEKRAEMVQAFFAVVNNYYAKRVTQWVHDLTIYSAIASAKLPKE